MPIFESQVKGLDISMEVRGVKSFSTNTAGFRVKV